MNATFLMGKARRFSLLFPVAFLLTMLLSFGSHDLFVAQAQALTITDPRRFSAPSEESRLNVTLTITPTTTRVSVASDGSQGNGNSFFPPAISGNGRYIAFMSEATNLVPNDTNNTRDIFVHDQLTGKIVRASVGPDGTQATGNNLYPAISADGRYVAFTGGANLVDYTWGFAPIVLKDMGTGQVTFVSHSYTITPTYGSSYQPSISADGRYVAFESYANNLVPNDTNSCPSSYNGNCFDVFVWDRQTNQIKRVSVASNGTQGNEDSVHARISPNGRYVAFASYATNLVSGHGPGLYLRDLQTNQTSFIAESLYGDFGASFSYDGRYLAFYSGSPLVGDDTNGFEDVFVYDQQTSAITRVSVASDGIQGNENSTNSASISSDGRYVAFDSWATNLVPNDTNVYLACDQHETGFPVNCPDVFVHDRLTGETTRVSVASDGTQLNHYTDGGSISSDGRFVVFESASNTLVANDTNNAWDIFVHDRFGGELPWSVFYTYIPLVERNH